LAIKLNEKVETREKELAEPKNLRITGRQEPRLDHIAVFNLPYLLVRECDGERLLKPYSQTEM
jgi:hypothetical protein